MDTVCCSKSMHEQQTEGYPVYQGTDLGVLYTPEMTLFRVWAPSATSILLRIYDQGHEGNLL